jgi:hypothetical protein
MTPKYMDNTMAQINESFAEGKPGEEYAMQTSNSTSLNPVKRYNPRLPAKK